MTIRIEANTTDLEDDARHLAESLKELDNDVEVWGPIRKAAGPVEDVLVEVLKIYFAYEIGRHVFPHVDAFLADWFIKKPRRDGPPLQVELYDQDKDLVATRRFGPEGYTDEMSEQLWALYENSEGRLTEEERHLVRAAADGIELLESALSYVKKLRDG